MSTPIDLKKLAEPFDPKEIDWRIGRAGGGAKPWASVLAYIDARAVMDRLDEVVGPENWKDRYWQESRLKDNKENDGGWMCGLSIRIDGEWVEKVDGSEETDIEAFKGGISKALVRAGVKWRIGRYLYNLGDGRAQIVGDIEGSRWQPEKKNAKYESQNHIAFNWLPPVLPDWAIPEVLRAQKNAPPQNAEQKPVEQKENVLPISKPNPKPDAAIPGSFVIGCAPFRGKRLNEIGQHDLNNWVSGWLKKKQAGASITGLLLEAITEGEKYLQQVERKRGSL